ncbi:MAG: ABC transporter ATP-binding protein [Blautia sp.]|nr:ABC transporter ATP-binding protein [Clostridia bacterium]MDY4693333.1 ABC transporter ATP-binding protein [Blautia sp.]MDY5554292.1 ABC transporter ATP-binding protein [Blautia sp.]
MEDILLEINHLKSSFFTGKGVVPAVDDVSIRIPKGKIVGIVGESGCGKSMTARSIMDLLKYPGKVVDGEILLEGRDLTKLSEKEVKKLRGSEISMIFQEPMTSLNPVVKVGKQVREAIIVHQKISKDEAKKKVLQAFEQVGISEPEKRYECYPHELSGGLRQRVMIAMAMVCRPKLMIADEPTTALDVTIEAQILKLIKKLCEDTGMSCLLISHNLGVIAQMCDYVYVMYAGKIVEQGDVFTIFEHPLHPYTQGLLASVIRLDALPDRLPTIPGIVPNLMHLPEGCAFCGRCNSAEDMCRTKRPQLYQAGEEHMVRCFLTGTKEAAHE